LVRLVATLPCHNDAKFLEEAVSTLKNKIEPLENDYLIVIAEDGSTDGSDAISRRLASQESSVLHIHADNKLGRGRALMNAWSKVDGEIYAYVDCDLATDMQFTLSSYDISMMDTIWRQVLDIQEVRIAKGPCCADFRA